MIATARKQSDGLYCGSRIHSAATMRCMITRRERPRSRATMRRIRSGAEKLFDRGSDGHRLIVMQHVPGVGDGEQLAVGERRHAPFQLRVEFWGRGFAREAAEAVVARAFTTLDIPALYAGHHPNNQASRGVLTHLGFHYTHDEFYPPTGQIEPCYLLLQGEFPGFSAP